MTALAASGTEAAAGNECRLSHLPAELISAVAPEWMWTPLFAVDLGHSAIAVMDRLVRARHAAADAITAGFSG